MSQPWGFTHRHEKNLRGWLARRWLARRTRQIRKAQKRL